MPWRRKPASWLRYWEGGSPSRTKAHGFKTALVYRVGTPDRDPRPMAASGWPEQPVLSFSLDTICLTAPRSLGVIQFIQIVAP
jgi:hypothetical protein